MVDERDGDGVQPGLGLSLLGGVDVTLDGVPLTGFVTLKSQALLCYLAMTNRPQSRETLAGLLWGDSPEGQAKASLRQELSNLQKLVGPFLQVTRQSVGFDRTSSYWLDVDAFMSAAQNGLSDAVGAHRYLTAAAALYAGDFLADFHVRDAPEFEEWVTTQRERLQKVVYQVLERLAQQYASRGNYGPASDCLGKLLELEPWREDAQRQQMLLLYHAGRRDAALSQYMTLRRVLRTELGEEPAAETTALYQRLRDGVVESLLPPPRRHNLLQPSAPLLGRRADVAHLSMLLTDPECRLLTLTGAGGIGKTRLALGVAIDLLDDFADGVFFVSLASIHDPDLLPQALATTLAIDVAPDRSVIEQLSEWLKLRQMLIVLDNFEHLLPAAPLVAQLLAACPRLSIVVTSRAVLRVRGERLFPVLPLALPDPQHVETPDRLLQRYGSVELFLRRAQAVRPDFELTPSNSATIAEICRRLDGLPLAIELAAARIRLLTPVTLLQRLDQRLALLTDGAGDLPVRQQTLRATIGWSYTLLPEPERKLFRRLAVFAGGATLEAMASVCGPLEIGGKDADTDVVQVLGSLSDQSLVLREDGPDAELRFTMLETIREYGAERLMESGEQEDVARQFAGYHVNLAETADLTGSRQTEWLHRLDLEHNNIQAALRWLHQQGDVDMELRLAGALWRFWYIRGHLSEGRHWLEDALAANAGGSATARVRALQGAGTLARYQGEYRQAESLHSEALELSRELGDVRGIAAVLNDLAATVLELGERSRAERLWEESLSHYRQVGDQRGTGIVIGNLGELAQLGGAIQRAQILHEESLALRREIGDRRGVAVALNNLGGVLHRLGENDLAAARFKESLRICQQLGEHRIMIRCLEGLAMLAAGQADGCRAPQLWAAAASLRETAGMPVPAIDRPQYERELQRARVEMGDREWAMAWEFGATMEPEHAVAYALSPHGPIEAPSIPTNR